MEAAGWRWRRGGGTHTYDSPLLPPARHRCGKAALSASPPGCIRRAALPRSHTRCRESSAAAACSRAGSRQLPAGLCGGRNGNGGERHGVRVVAPWGPQLCQLLCVAAPAGCGQEAALVKQMLMCSPHLTAPWDNSHLVWAVIAEGGGSFAVQGGEVARGTDPAPYHPHQGFGAGPRPHTNPETLEEGTQSPPLCSSLAVGCPARLLRALLCCTWPFSFHPTDTALQ